MYNKINKLNLNIKNIILEKKMNKVKKTKIKK